MRLVQHIVSISIHTPLAGSDGTARPWSRPCGNFNPHSPCGERQYAYRHPSVKVEISIHTPLAGSDEAGAAVLVKADVISIHTPLAGSDSLLCGRYQYNKFQSTLPLRGATQIITIYTSQEKISIHTPLAGSDPSQSPASGYDRISIHTPLAGSDPPPARPASRETNFNPHSPCGERPMLFHVGAAQVNISIHTPLAGSDHAGTARKGWALYFNPHSPCGERLAFCFNRPHSSIFQSTLPLRGATSRLLRSIRVPKYFNPHSPCGERRHRTRSTTHLLISIHTPLAGSDAMPELFVRDRLRISIHTPLAGSDTGAVESIEIQGISIHTPLAGSDGSTAPCVARRKYFNPHSPCGERRVWGYCFVRTRSYFNPHSPCGERPS